MAHICTLLIGFSRNSASYGAALTSDVVSLHFSDFFPLSRRSTSLLPSHPIPSLFTCACITSLPSRHVLTSHPALRRMIVAHGRRAYICKVSLLTYLPSYARQLAVANDHWETCSYVAFHYSADVNPHIIQSIHLHSYLHFVSSFYHFMSHLEVAPSSAPF